VAEEFFKDGIMRCGRLAHGEYSCHFLWHERTVSHLIKGWNSHIN